MIAKEKSYDYEYYMNLPEGTRAELIDGQIYDMAAAPNTLHQTISSFLVGELRSYLKGKTCKVFHAPFDVFLGVENKTIRDCKNIVQPDISVICGKNKITKQGCVGAPDFVVEIVSRSSRAMDYIKKLSLYFEYGVREYWIVDPIEQIILVYVAKDDDFSLKMYNFQDKLNLSIFNELTIDFNELDSDFYFE